MAKSSCTSLMAPLGDVPKKQSATLSHTLAIRNMLVLPGSPKGMPATIAT